MSVPALNVAIQGQGIISADNLNTFIQTAQNTTQLRYLTGTPGMVVQLQGIVIPNDGGAGFFYWNQSGTEPDDNYNYITPTGSGTGQWVRIAFAQTISPGLFTTLTVSELATFKSDVTIGGILSISISQGISGTGSTQGTAMPLIANLNIATTVMAGTGFILPLVTASLNAIQLGTEITLLNRGANTASLYPASGGQIEALGTNNPSGIAPGGSSTAIYSGFGQWWIL